MHTEAEKFNVEHFVLQLWDKKNNRWTNTGVPFYQRDKALWYLDYMSDFVNAPMRVCQCEVIS